MAKWQKIGTNRYRLIAKGFDAEKKRIQKTKNITLAHEPAKGELDRAAAIFENEVMYDKQI